METGSLLLDLNAAQREAVTATEGFIRVIAGAGSGKTAALSRRFAFLVNEIGILPSHILCVTFTNKAANEMKRRIHSLTGDNDTGMINTFHGFCVSVLQEDAHAVAYPKSFIVLDNSDIDAMLRIIYEERGLTLRHKTFSQARDMIEMQKCVYRPEYCEDLIRMDLDTLKRKYEAAVSVNDIIFYGYLYQEKKCFALDYNDLIKFVLHIFRENEEIRLKWQQRLEYIMIDEFQDIDPLQVELMRVLCGYHKNLFVVGDPDQTIYTWRGANIRYLLDFDKEYPGTRTIYMMQNYRSTPEILAVANSLIDKNRERLKKDLIPQLPAGPVPVCKYAQTAAEEAAWIAEQIRALHEGGTAFRDIAVLYRAHYLTKNLEEALIEAKLPYEIYSGVPFLERMEIKDALSYLRMIAFRDDLSFERIVNVPKRNMGKRRMKALHELAEAEGATLFETLRRHLEDPLFSGTGAARFVNFIDYYAKTYAERDISDLFSEVLDRSGYEKMLRTEGGQMRLDNLAQLKQAVHDYVTSAGEECRLEDWLQSLALLTNTDLDAAPDKIRLMTVHAAKGLEFPYVFLCGMNEGIFPSGKSDTRKAIEEERRLAFVAVTRAQKGLWLTEAQGRIFDGSPRYPSRFLLDIDDGLFVYDTPPRDDLIADTRLYLAAKDGFLAEEAAGEYFEAGSRVTHTVLGPGTVLETDRSRGTYLIQFDASPTPRTLSVKVKALQPLSGSSAPAPGDRPV